MPVQVRRVYEEPVASDGPRFLVDGIWPRDFRREQVPVEAWLKGLAPSAALRKWFGHDPTVWDEFKRRYWAELDKGASEVDTLRAALAEGAIVTLVYSARGTDHNNAVALKEYLEQHAARQKPAKRRTRLTMRPSRYQRRFFLRRCRVRT